MAKLQGHLLKYKHNVDECVSRAKEIIKDSNEGQSEMNISVWLNRLNMKRYIPKFREHKVYRVQDLKDYAEEKVVKEELKIIEDQ